MKRAQVRQRRRDPAGRELLNIVCPHCDGRHWVPAEPTGTCPRRQRVFTIAAVPRKVAS